VQPVEESGNTHHDEEWHHGIRTALKGLPAGNATRKLLSGFSMDRVTAAEAAVLPELEPILGVRLVLCRDIVAPLALGACQGERRSLIRGHEGPRFVRAYPVSGTEYSMPTC
jgi:hypothetical protein